MPKLKTTAVAVSLLAVAAIALGGCGSDDSESDVPSASSLVGTWSASQVGYGDNDKLEGPYPSTFIIKKADNSSRSFAGERLVTAADAEKYGIPAKRSPIVGEISPWGEVSIVHADGTWTLEMDGEDKMEGLYLETGNDLAAKSLTLTREK